jgi:hypothetical protein
MNMGRAVLMVAFHFPPADMSSGHLRTLAFARYLPRAGWDPIVLSARAMAYPQTARAGLDAIPRDCVVRRAFALDAKRHLGIAGKYPWFLALPDRWASWWPAAVLQGLRLIRQHRAQAIWSTYPIMTAHCVAHSLHRITGLPWIADFRDPVASSVSPTDRHAAASRQHWEAKVLGAASRVVFTTPGTLRDYAERFPTPHAAGRLAVIENGYDELAFSDLPAPGPRQPCHPLVLVHSGLLYSRGRNPIPFLTALAKLKSANRIDPDGVRVVLRASRLGEEYVREIRRLGLAEMVSLPPPVPYREALFEQAAADGLLLFQGQEFDRQIPAKLYEYLRIGRPIFALIGSQGDTASVLQTAGGAELAPIDDVAAIADKLDAFIHALRDGRAPVADPGVVKRCARDNGAMLLAGHLERITA